MNSALAMIEATAPNDEIEGALAVQMACTHIAAMNVLSRFDGCITQKRVEVFAAGATRLMRTYTMQVETLRRLKRGGSQFVRVEHDGATGALGSLPRAEARRPNGWP